MSNLDQLIETAKNSFVAIEAAYQAADINAKVAMAPQRDQVASQLVALQTRQLKQNASAITDDDIAQMADLKKRIDNAAEIQTALTGFVSILAKFVL
ncbi:hypothetical protein [Thalassospira sp.]|uniref:hypothetical protein n=1 Tax=Thalassospira sp. TaxID=1912094 RepID=UPI002736317A|nr:hypothetical protein [Thalassospira sp.]MDP2698832.1 hypothetical protein [Thalassospira sp.]